ncbi:MAG: hypothetical protein U9N81_06310 [Bacillota bacterium]|nr:hypothetical protein [Bacillota bacterium]
MFRELRLIGLHVIGMIKKGNQRYRHNQNPRRFGDLFFLFCDEIQGLDYEKALRQLMFYCMILLAYVPKELAQTVSCQVMHWIADFA